MPARRVPADDATRRSPTRRRDRLAGRVTFTPLPHRDALPRVDTVSTRGSSRRFVFRRASWKLLNSKGDFGRGSRIRTDDLEYPKLPRYQTALCPAESERKMRRFDTRFTEAQQVGARTTAEGEGRRGAIPALAGEHKREMPAGELDTPPVLCRPASGTRDARPGRRRQCRISWRSRRSLRARREPAGPMRESGSTSARYSRQSGRSGRFRR
jgi:hypothetical protein